MMQEYSVDTPLWMSMAHSVTHVPQASQALNSDLSNIANTEPLHKLEIDDSGTGTNNIKIKKIALK